jgi:hypothetical protein
MKKKTAVGCALVLVGALAGCGGGSSSPSVVTTPTVPAAVRTLVGQGTFQLIDSDTAIRLGGGVDFATQVFTLGAAGTVDVTVDWTFRSNDIDIGIFRGSCNPDQLAAGVCGASALAQSLSTTAKPETLSVRLDPGSYTLLVRSNVGNSAESGTFAIFVTR